MYLDGAVKIDDNSIIVDEHDAQTPDPHGNQAGPAPDGRQPYPYKERRRRPRPTQEELPPKNRPTGGAKSLAISVCLGALLLAGSIGTGLYYLKYKAPENAAETLAPRPLVLPSPAAPEPTFKEPVEVKPADTVAAGPEEPLQNSTEEELQQHELQEPEPTAAAPPAPSSAGKDMQPPADTSAAEDRRQHAAKPVVQAKPAPTPKAKEALQPGNYHLLCGSFKSRQKALSATEKLKRNRYPAFVEKADLGAKGIWYRIKIGGFSTSQEAARTRDKIKRTLNFEALVRKNR